MSWAIARLNRDHSRNATLERDLCRRVHLHLWEGSDPLSRCRSNFPSSSVGIIRQVLRRLPHHRLRRSGFREVYTDFSPDVLDEALDACLIAFVERDCDTLFLSRHLPFSSSVPPRRTHLTRSEPTSSLSPKLKKDGNDRSRQPPLFRFSTKRVSGSGSTGQPVSQNETRPNANPYPRNP